MKRLAIIGASGHGKVVADVAIAAGVGSISFYDDKAPDIKRLGQFKVVGNTGDAIQDSGLYDSVIVAIGNAQTREKIQKQLVKVSSAIVHPASVIGSDVHLGEGTVVMPGAIINAGVQIGSGAIINSGAVIEHDCCLGDFVHVCPNASIAGGVTIGSHSWIGIGASVIQSVLIGEYATVGAGAVVIHKVADNQTVIGIPAKPTNK
ncbi:acetyltransferase [Idiomarina abyssalis]|jgi:sugar O-acyltransferase (sialic acid O-acetyltransferase NeuD family)|uniref:acetyltransferase n=1 Tax=Idiomarina abyssalis TaxID=86102 RepID=UPI0006C88F82|nr:acetyltransferase [Idiomarina abyssalis]KPD20482.1 hypothetical protein ADS78_11635 [Idiomarina abyssalis]SFT69468.1 sugar O-acyltransferase, sialic acid O-acetyltransferase NeuD family [Idiomarina abyssalis]